jgi:hypothetical protein
MSIEKINTILENVHFTHQLMKPVAYEIQAIVEAHGLDEQEAEFKFKDWVYKNKDGFIHERMMIEAANDVWFSALDGTSQPPDFTDSAFRKCKECGCRKAVVERYALGYKVKETLICGHTKVR